MFPIRNKLTKFLLKLILLLAKIFAVAPVQFDYKSGEISAPHRILVYTISIHVVCIFFMPIFINMKFDEIELFKRKPLTASINQIYVLSRSLTLAATLVWNWIQRKRLIHTIGDFYSIQREHFANVEVPRCLRLQFDIVVLSNFVITIYQIFAAVFLVFIVNPNPSAKYCVVAFYIVFCQCILIVTPNQIFLGVLLARIRFRILNEQLCTTVGQIRVMHAKRETKPRIGILMQISCDLADKIDEIGQCRRRNIKFVKEVTRLYQFPLLLIVASFFITNIAYSFFVLVFIHGKDIEITAFGTLLSVQNILMNALELVVLVCMCDGTVEAADYPGVILRGLTELYPAVVDERLEASCEEFLLNLMREKLEFKLCGMLCLDRKLMLMMTSSMFMYLIILVQFDYRSLFQ